MISLESLIRSRRRIYFFGFSLKTMMFFCRTYEWLASKPGRSVKRGLIKKSDEERESLRLKILKRRIQKRERRAVFLEKAQQRNKAQEVKLRNRLRRLDERERQGTNVGSDSPHHSVESNTNGLKRLSVLKRITLYTKLDFDQTLMMRDVEEEPIPPLLIEMLPIKLNQINEDPWNWKGTRNN
jgi:hypothetical protein